MVDWLPLASVTCADTVAVPLASVVASVEGIVALQVVPAPLPSRYSVLLTPLSVTLTLKVLLGRNPAHRAAQRHAGMSLGSVDDVVAVDRAIVTAGPVSATVTLWVAMVDWLPLASVTCAGTVAVPLASVVASVEGIVALQAGAGAVTVAM